MSIIGLEVINMTVYLDVLIIVNIYITYFILKAAARLLHIKYRFFRLAAGAVFGGFSSLAAVLSLDFLGALLLKSALMLITALIAFGFGGGSRFLTATALCTGISILICGAALLIRELFGGGIIGAAGGYPYLDISALTLVGATAAVYGGVSLFRRFLDKPTADSRVELIIEYGGNRVEIEAFPDSGNGLCDFLSGTPVIICKAAPLEKLLPENIKQILGGEYDLNAVKGIRLIPCNTVKGSGYIAAFRPDRITAELGGCKKRINALIGVDKDLFEGEGFDAILNPKILI